MHSQFILLDYAVSGHFRFCLTYYSYYRECKHLHNKQLFTINCDVYVLARKMDTFSWNVFHTCNLAMYLGKNQYNLIKINLSKSIPFIIYVLPIIAACKSICYKTCNICVRCAFELLARICIMSWPKIHQIKPHKSLFIHPIMFIFHFYVYQLMMHGACSISHGWRMTVYKSSTWAIQ